MTSSAGRPIATTVGLSAITSPLGLEGLSRRWSALDAPVWTGFSPASLRLSLSAWCLRSAIYLPPSIQQRPKRKPRSRSHNGHLGSRFPPHRPDGYPHEGHRHGRHHARHVHDGHGPDDRRYLDAPHHRRSWRLRPLQLGWHRLSARLYGHRARRGKADGHLRPQAFLHGGHLHPYPRLRALRLISERRATDRLPRRSGSRRGDDHGRRLRYPRRRLHAGRAGPLGRPDVRRIRLGERDRPSHRRDPYRPRALALDLLRQPSPRRACPDSSSLRDAQHQASGEAQAGLSRDRTAVGHRGPSAARVLVGRQPLRMALAASDRLLQLGRAGPHRLYLRRDAHRRAAPTDIAVPQPHLRGLRLDHPHYRRRHDGEPLLHTALRPGRDRPFRHELRSGHHANDDLDGYRQWYIWPGYVASRAI